MKNIEKGDSFISQTIVAELCGVGQTTISKYIKRSRDILKLNEFNQLHYDSLQRIAQHYALESQRPTKKAQDFYKWISEPQNSLSNLEEYKYIAPTKAPKSSKGFVYLIKCNEWYKIGKAKNVNSRLSGLQTGSPYLLELLHAIHCKDYSRAESYLHNVFADRRGLGEWFELTENDIEKIKAIKTL